MADVISTVPAYRALASIDDPRQRRAAWVHEYERAHANVFDRYYAGWGNPDRRDAAADAVPELLEKITARETAMRALVDSLPAQLSPLGVDATGLDVVLLVGGHTSNGWSTTLDGKPTLFIALEFLNDNVGDEVLAVHEGLHTVHRRHIRDTDGIRDTVALNLFYEGLAVAVSRLALPGLSDSHYLWFDEDHDEWVRDCEEREVAMRTHVATHLDTESTDPRVAGLFLNKPIGGLPTRCGYWLGDRMIRDWLADGAAVPQLLDMPLRTALDRTHAWCSATKTAT